MAKESTRSMAGLRDALFDVLDKVRAGEVDADQAKAAATVAQTILDSAKVQMDYERMRLDSIVPSTLPEMALIPTLTAEKQR